MKLKAKTQIFAPKKRPKQQNTDFLNEKNKTISNYPRKAQAPYNKINKNSVITEFKNSRIIGWVLVALDYCHGFLLPSKFA